MHDGIDHREEAHEAHNGCHLDAADIEDRGIEHRLIGTAATHKAEADNNNQHADSQQYKVGLAERIISYPPILVIVDISLISFNSLTSFNSLE